jgi:murein DD-endopeptidase MepM/ murein hydrolase activator NlpD
MHLNILHIKRSLFALSTLALSGACFVAPSFATPTQSPSIAINVFGSPTTAADAAIVQLWQQQSDLSSSLEAIGLIVHDEDHKHNNTDGIGGDFDPENKFLAPKSELMFDMIDQVADQAERREASLERLNQSIISRDQAKVQISADILAVEPVANARVSSPYGYRHLGGREFHSGIDLSVPYGSTIYATGKGVVVYSGWKGGYGNFIEIDHGNGYLTRYGHASRLLVSVGDSVDKNQEIGLVGCSGRCTGPHVHYEVVLNGKRQNPATYLALAPRREE